jgi:XTP/dITP diphosphohydrolase
MPNVAEDTGTFEGNGLKKARALRPMAPPSCGVLSDDSGLCVDALDGRPGVDSAYFAGKPGNPNANLELLVERMKGIAPPQRSAHFVCVLVYIDPVGGEHLFEGRCDGTLLEAPEGSRGFGYDPLFAPEGHKNSFASLPMKIKNSMSARGRAWHNFSRWLIESYKDSHC